MNKAGLLDKQVRPPVFWSAFTYILTMFLLDISCGIKCQENNDSIWIKKILDIASNLVIYFIYKFYIHVQN